MSGERATGLVFSRAVRYDCAALLEPGDHGPRCSMSRTSTSRRSELGGSLLTKRSVVVNGHKTSASIERPFWDALREIAIRTDTKLQALISKIDQDRQHKNLSSCIRLFVLDFYRSAGQTSSFTSTAAAEKTKDVPHR
jgi:predicted DNA-binding ribbon-helix-helix protein